MSLASINSFSASPAILADYADACNFSELKRRHARAVGEMCEKPIWSDVLEFLAELQPEDVGFTVEDGTIVVGASARAGAGAGAGARAGAGAGARASQIAQKLCPWRKGPFRIAGLEIDAEWRSDRKWERIELDVRGKKVLDLACNNGYYLYRLLEHEPEFVLGLDPVERCFLQFELVQRFARAERVGFGLLGIDDMDLFPRFFDTILCLGLLYHLQNPLKELKAIRSALAPGGELILETLIIEGEEDIALVPQGRYANMKNVYFLPTIPVLTMWLKRAGFRRFEVQSVVKTSTKEQRRTRFCDLPSLAEFLESDGKTVEGYPAPVRCLLSAS